MKLTDYLAPRCRCLTVPIRPRRKRSRLPGSVVLALTVMLGLTAAAAAQNFPSRLVRFIVPFPASGGRLLFIRAAPQDLIAKCGTPPIGASRVGAGRKTRSHGVAPDAA